MTGQQPQTDLNGIAGDRSAEIVAEQNKDRIYRAQTSMLQWLRRLGHPVMFGPAWPAAALAGGNVLPTIPELAHYDGKPCPYCRFTMMRGARRFPTRDHVRPRRSGGTLHPANCLIVCAPCNNDKAAMMLREFLAWLEARRDPRAANVERLLASGADRFDATTSVERSPDVSSRE